QYSYAVTAFESQAHAGTCDGDSCFTTRVTVARLGDAVFGQQLEVEFSNHQRVSERWDGRDASRTLEFVSSTPAVAARLDSALLLDTNRLDDARVTPAPSNVPIAKWMARWLVWVQDAMLDYGVLF
ncbi:MAG: hypothetical protein ABI665_06840, partial [Vicinamibacterales bacterium]